MISTFALNSKKYSDLPLTYAPATGFKWRLLSAYVLSSDVGMTASFDVIRNGTDVKNVLSSTTAQYLDALDAGDIRYGVVDIGSLDGFKIHQTGGVTGDTVTAIITVEVLPA